MPIVFVHGVATRRGTEYEEGVRARHAFLREYVDRLRLGPWHPSHQRLLGRRRSRVPLGPRLRFQRRAWKRSALATPLEDVVLAKFVDPSWIATTVRLSPSPWPIPNPPSTCCEPRPW
jgi:hypothetical protein